MIIVVEDLTKAITFAFGDRAVRFHYLKTEGGHRDPQIIGAEFIRMLANEVLYKRLDLVEHR
ncbi:hypothetical protein D3C72_2361930 [compost metagenome]